MAESRSGARGGWGRFDWESIKEDKYRANYLGNSIKAPVGRWQRGKDPTWYVKPGCERLGVPCPAQSLDSDTVAQEIRQVQEQEKRLLREALSKTI